MYPFISAETLAEDLGISLASAKRALSAGTQRGWVRHIRRRGFQGPIERAMSYCPSVVDEIEVRRIRLRAAREARRLQRAHPRSAIGVTGEPL
jgi:hypothetical protein